MAGGVRLPELEATTKRCRVERIAPKVFRIVLTQGLNRQIRRMCDAFGYDVRRLQRVRIINLRLGELKVGKWRDLSEAELAGLLPKRFGAPDPAARG
jgi:23S rRNA pseudouridine2604 synthase